MPVTKMFWNIGTSTAKVLDVVGYGLKDHCQVPLDLNPSEQVRDLRTHDQVFSMRIPDGITTLRYNGFVYVLTGNEGDDFVYRGFEFISQTKDVFKVSAK